MSNGGGGEQGKTSIPGGAGTDLDAGAELVDDEGRQGFGLDILSDHEQRPLGLHRGL